MLLNDDNFCKILSENEKFNGFLSFSKLEKS
jgi:hypothetical protein